jgi:nucleoside-diphosphate-sugar epimerase
VLDALARDGIHPRRGLFVSSTAVYGDLDGDVDETTMANPTAFNGRVLLAAEDLFLGRLPQGTVLRLGGIYGPGRDRLIRQVRSGEARALARRTTRIHRDDAAAAVVHLMTMPTPPDAIYLGVDDQPAVHADVVRFLAHELGVPAPESAGVPSARGADRAVSNARLRNTGWAPVYPTYVEGYRAILAGSGTRHP